MAKLTLTDLTDLTNQSSAVTTINNNNAAIETALENTLSRDGTTPNTMSADFDMNGNQILNLPAPVAATDVLRLGDIDLTVNGALFLVGTSTSNVAVGSGTKVFETQSGKLFNVGQYVVAVATGSTTPLMYGQVTSYSGTTLTINSIYSTGSGSHASWDIQISGAPSQLAVLADGDYGDIVASAGTINFDTSVVTAAAKTVLDDATTGAMRTTLGVGTTDSPEFLNVNVGNATDTTVSRSSAGVIAVEGVAVPLQSITNTHVMLSAEVGHATDSTITRVSAGTLAIEGQNILTSATGQPLDSDLTAIAALTTTVYGRGLLELADETALEATLDTLPNVTSLQGLTVTLADAGADAVLGWDDSASAYENLTAAEVLAIVATVDGTGSGLDADLLDGKNTGTSGNTVPLLDGTNTWSGTQTFPNTGIVVGVSTPFSDAAGTLTLQNIDALDAATESTIESAIDTLANLTSIQGRTVTLADAGANAFLGWDDVAGAYENLTAAEALAIITTVDGSGSGLDADLLDGKNTGTSGNTVPLLDGTNTWSGVQTFGNTGIVVGTSTPFSDAAGTLTLQNVDALDGTTESTIEAAIDTLANLTSIQSRTVTLADAGTDAVLGWDDSASAYENLTAAEVVAIIATADGTGSGLDADLLDGKNTGTSGNVVPLLDGTNTWSGTQTFGNTGIVVGASTPFSDAAGTLTLQNVDALDATTESTIEAAIDTLANLTSVQGRTVTLADAGANAIFGWDDVAGAYENLSATEATAVINIMTGDAGSGGLKGLVPTQVAGDSTKFLRGDGTFQTIPGGGDALTSGNLSQFAATSSLQLKGVISDETGSGALVFAEAPTFSNGDVVLADGNGMVFGHTAQIAADGITPEIQIIGTSTTGVDSSLLIANYSTTATSPALLILAKSDQGTPGSFALLDNDDTIGGIHWVADDGVDLTSVSASIMAYIEGATGSNDMPGRLVFATASDGASTATDRWIIDSLGALKPASDGIYDIGTVTLGVNNIHLDTGSVINWENGEVTLTQSADNLTLGGGSLTLAAGTTTIAPLILQSGTNLTAAVDGGIEFDGTCIYGTTDADNRGVIPCFHYAAVPSGHYTLTSSTSEQALFTGANDTLTLETGLYLFEGQFYIASMSATSGNAAFDLLGAGTATITRQHQHHGRDAAIATVGTGNGSADVAQTAASMVTAGTSTVLTFFIKGAFRVTGAGTIIPSITLVTAAAAVVQNNSYFKCYRIGSSTAEAVGQWS